jgi:uncharacterized coiled-coil DUF342 family protein
LGQSTVTEIAQCLKIMKMYTVGSDKFKNVMQEIRELRVKHKEYNDKLHGGNLKQKTPDEVTSYFIRND